MDVIVAWDPEITQIKKSLTEDNAVCNLISLVLGKQPHANTFFFKEMSYGSHVNPILAKSVVYCFNKGAF